MAQLRLKSIHVAMLCVMYRGCRACRRRTTFHHYRSVVVTDFLTCHSVVPSSLFPHLCMFSGFSILFLDLQGIGYLKWELAASVKTSMADACASWLTYSSLRHAWVTVMLLHIELD
jgi:hypothetical protein